MLELLSSLVLTSFRFSWSTTSMAQVSRLKSLKTIALTTPAVVLLPLVSIPWSSMFSSDFLQAGIDSRESILLDSFFRLYKSNHGVIRMFFFHIQALFSTVNLIMRFVLVILIDR